MLVFIRVLSKLIYDLRSSLSPFFKQIYSSLLSLLTRADPLSAPVLTLLFAAISSLLRYVPAKDQSLKEVYKEYVGALRECKSSEIQRAGGEVWGVSVLRKWKDKSEAIRVLMEGLDDDDGVVEAWSVVAALQVSHSFISILWLD